MKEKSPVMRGLLSCVRLQQLLAPLSAMAAAFDAIVGIMVPSVVATGRLGCGIVNISRPAADVGETFLDALTAALTALCHF